MAVADGRKFREDFAEGGEAAARAMQRLISEFAQGMPAPKINHQPGDPAFKRILDDRMRAAEECNDPGGFNTFIAFERTSLIKGDSLRRNAIFRDGPERAGQVVPCATTAPIGPTNPRDLGKWRENREAKTGGDGAADPPATATCPTA